MKKILISSGGTLEKIDEIRVITNISTGKLGAKIAEVFGYENPVSYRVEDGEKGPQYEIYYLHTKTAVRPNVFRFIERHTVEESILENGMKQTTYRTVMENNVISIEASSVQEVYDKMEELVPQMDVVIQCMAISDFTFNRDNPVKLKSNDTEGFINYMRDNIRQSPKIISKIKKWNPDVFLVGFKFEVGMDESKLIETACNAKMNNGADLVIANDKKMMQEAGEHVAWVCRSIENYYRVSGKPEIAKAILNEVREHEKIKKIQRTIDDKA